MSRRITRSDWFIADLEHYAAWYEQEAGWKSQSDIYTPWQRQFGSLPNYRNWDSRRSFSTRNCVVFDVTHPPGLSRST